MSLSQWGWRAFQFAIVSGIGYWAYSDPEVKASSFAIMIFGILVAALLTGLLSALFRSIRFALGRSTEEDRIWRATPTPRSNLAPPEDLA